MGLIAQLLSFARTVRNGASTSDVKADPGGGAVMTSAHFAPPGDDSHPLPGDYVAVVRVQGASRSAAVGYLDPANDQKATPGGKRLYARSPATGASVVEVWLKADGSVKGSNAAGSFELRANGDFVVNGVTITPAGDISTPGDVSAAELAAPSVKAAGKELAGHDHPILGGSSAPGPTGPNN